MKAAFTMKNPTLAALQAFVAVAERRSFRAAADFLGVSPSAVSQAVRTLETRIGQPLFQRTTRSVTPTEAGAGLLRDAGPALAQALAALEAAGSEAGSPSGRLRLSVPRLALAPIARILPAFTAACPNATVELVVEDRLVDIVGGGFDAGIRFGEKVARDMTAVRLTRPFRFVVVGSPQYIAEHGEPRTPAALERHRCMVHVSPTTGSAHRWELERGRRTYRVGVSGPVMCSSDDGHRLGALAGLGLAYVAEYAVEDDVKAGRLQIVLSRYAAQTEGFFIYYPSRTQRRQVLTAFIAAARQAL